MDPPLQRPVGETRMRSETPATPSRRSVALSTSALLLAAALAIFASPAGAQASLDGCPHSQGFWKSHAELWPAEALTLGDESYDQAGLQGLLDAPPKGDASMILAHQLIAAKLNIAAGAQAGPFEAAIDRADALLTPYEGPLPYDVRNQRGPPSAERVAMIDTAGTLDELNNEDDLAACGTPPGEVRSDVGVSAHGSTSATGQPLFDINVTSDGRDAATGVAITFTVSVIDPAASEGGWDLRVNSTHPDAHRTSIVCPSVSLDETVLTATCEFGLDMAPGDWVDLSLIGSGWSGQALSLDAAVTADVDTDPADDQASASLGA